MVKRLIGTFLSVWTLASCSAGMPGGLGLNQGRLAPCPKSPNCVSTQAEDREHGMEAIPYLTSLDEARESMRAVILSMPRATIVASSGDYLHAEFRSKLFRFVDDVEFYFDDAEKRIHFRSASRIGHSDLGVNRKRMDAVREKFENPGH
jgi:uncharacterized protein (DUF1499 family)